LAGGFILKRVLSKKERIEQAKKELNKTLKKTGYLSYLAKHGESARPSFPNLKIPENKITTSDKIIHVAGKKELPKDAKQFNVQSPHKQGLMLYIPSDGMEHAGGKKS